MSLARDTRVPHSNVFVGHVASEHAFQTVKAAGKKDSGTVRSFAEQPVVGLQILRLPDPTMIDASCTGVMPSVAKALTPLLP